MPIPTRSELSCDFDSASAASVVSVKQPFTRRINDLHSPKPKRNMEIELLSIQEQSVLTHYPLGIKSAPLSNFESLTIKHYLFVIFIP